MRKLNLPKLFVSFLLIIPLAVSAQTISDTLLSNGYMFDHFVPGRVLLKSGKVQEAMLNYNLNDQTIAFEDKGQYMILNNPDDVDTVYIQEKRFIPATDKFYESLTNTKIALLATYTGKLKPLLAVTEHDGTKRENASQVSNTITDIYSMRNYKGNYTVELKKRYWLRRGNTLYKADNEKQILKVFHSKAQEIDKYIIDNHLDLSKEADLVKVVEYGNE